MPNNIPQIPGAIGRVDASGAESKAERSRLATSLTLCGHESLVMAWFSLT